MPDLFDVGVGYLISKHGFDLEEAEAIAKQHAPPDRTERELLRKIRAAMEEFKLQHGHDPERLQVIAKSEERTDRGLLSENETTGESLAHAESRQAALTTATARELANQLASRAHARDPSRPLEWHLGMVYQQRPELYESENRVSDLASRRRYAATPSEVGLD